MLELNLPYPPSVNRTWRMVGGRMLLSRKVRLYRQRVQMFLAAKRVGLLLGRLAMAVNLAPPDRRKRDIDNAQKSLLDALQAGGVFRDDSQIDLLLIQRMPVVPGGQAHVCIAELPLERCLLCGGPCSGGIVETNRARTAGVVVPGVLPEALCH